MHVTHSVFYDPPPKFAFVVPPAIVLVIVGLVPSIIGNLEYHPPTVLVLVSPNNNAIANVYTFIFIFQIIIFSIFKN